MCNIAVAKDLFFYKYINCTGAEKNECMSCSLITYSL